MKKFVAAGAAALVLLGGSAVAVRQATDSESCVKPRTLFESEQRASIDALEAYISDTIAASFKNPDQLLWGSDDYSPVLTPGKIAARIMVMEGATMSATRSYHVTLTRDCQGDEWKVVEFKRLNT